MQIGLIGVFDKSDRLGFGKVEAVLDDPALPDPLVDPELEKRPTYQAGALTDTPDRSRYDE